MYNRYLPQPDGSYRRQRVQEPVIPAPPPHRQTAREDSVPAPQPDREAHDRRETDAPSQEQPSTRSQPPQRERQNQSPHRPASQSVDGFLRQLLPADFDTGDFMVVLLLLLIAGDNPDQRGNALMTLLLYLMM